MQYIPLSRPVRARWAIAYAVLVCASVLMAPAGVYAGKVERDSDKDILWKAGVDGVEIEWGPGGEFKRVYSAASQAVKFPDRAGILKAQTIAEEKAKAAIVRFINQQVGSTRLVEQVDRDSETAVRTQNETSDSISKETKRQMVETLTEITSSSAWGQLRGVITLEKGYDEKRAEAWVRVGLSQKTMQAAGDLGRAIQSTGQAVSNNPAQKGKPSEMRQGSEVRQSKQKEW